MKDNNLMSADLPPIGTRWGDLTDAQRARIPEGTVLGPPPEHREWGTLTLVPGGWSTSAGYVLELLPPVPDRPILSYPPGTEADPRPAAVTITLTPALYDRARAAGMPEGERNIAEWLVSRGEVAAASDRGVYPHTTARRAGGTAFCRCGHAALVAGATWGDDCPLALRAALAAKGGDGG